MTNNQYARLEEIGRLLLDLRLAELRRAAIARQHCLDRLEALNLVPASDLDPVTAARTELRYLQWAEVRRAEINPVLARRTVDWLTAQGAARDAFGKTEALRLMRERRR